MEPLKINFNVDYKLNIIRNDLNLIDGFIISFLRFSQISWELTHKVNVN